MSLEAKKGKVTFLASVFENVNEDFLKAFFSIFYPISIDKNSVAGVYVFHGYSNLFDALNTGDTIPEYRAYFIKNEDSSIVFHKFLKVIDMENEIVHGSPAGGIGV